MKRRRIIRRGRNDIIYDKIVLVLIMSDIHVC